MSIRPAAEWRRCTRCAKPVRADRAIHGYGRACAALLGLTGGSTDTGHDGPDLLDLLTNVTQLDGT